VFCVTIAVYMAVWCVYQCFINIWLSEVSVIIMF